MSRLPHPYDVEREAEACIAFAQGERAERERIKAILESNEARGREGSAVHLAVRTDMPARSALLFLETVPRAEIIPAFNVRPARFPTIRLELKGYYNEKSSEGTDDQKSC